MYRPLPAITTLEPSSNNEKEVAPTEGVVKQSCPVDAIGNGSCSDVNKLGWLKSQIIGGEADFDSPFGVVGSPTPTTWPPAGSSGVRRGLFTEGATPFLR